MSRKKLNVLKGTVSKLFFCALHASIWNLHELEIYTRVTNCRTVWHDWYRFRGTVDWFVQRFFAECSLICSSLSALHYRRGTLSGASSSMNCLIADSVQIAMTFTYNDVVHPLNYETRTPLRRTALPTPVDPRPPVICITFRLLWWWRKEEEWRLLYKDSSSSRTRCSSCSD